ncbi:MAG: hypothetical protein IPM54_02800 [Polyangiaceae bacterium]|nr:hypothetical protein [Polyangiaceae bacterium]
MTHACSTHRDVDPQCNAAVAARLRLVPKLDRLQSLNLVMYPPSLVDNQPPLRE